MGVASGLKEACKKKGERRNGDGDKKRIDGERCTDGGRRGRYNDG